MGKTVIFDNGGPNLHTFAYAKTHDYFGNGFI